MKKGDYVDTPRFLKVRIEEVYNSEAEARKAGFTETTHYWNDPEFGVMANPWICIIWSLLDSEKDDGKWGF